MFWFLGVLFGPWLLARGALPGAPVLGDGDPPARSVDRFDDGHGAVQLLAQVIGQCLGAVMARKVALNGQLVLTVCIEAKPGIKNALLHQIAESLIAGVVEIAAAPAQELESVQLLEQGWMAIQAQRLSLAPALVLMHMPFGRQECGVSRGDPFRIHLGELDLKNLFAAFRCPADPRLAAVQGLAGAGTGSQPLQMIEGCERLRRNQA